MNQAGLGHDDTHIYIWDRDLWNTAMLGKRLPEIPAILRAHKEIFIGHTSTVSYNTDKPMNELNVWNLDTGAGFNGKLTIMDIETKKYWQSDPVKELYPNELGR